MEKRRDVNTKLHPYDMLELPALVKGSLFFYTDNEGVLTEEEIEKVCKKAFVKTIIAYRPEMEVKFQDLQDRIVKTELVRAKRQKKRGLLNLDYDLRISTPSRSAENLLYKEYRENGYSPNFKQRALKLLLKKRKQYEDNPVDIDWNTVPRKDYSSLIIKNRKDDDEDQ